MKCGPVSLTPVFPVSWMTELDIELKLKEEEPENLLCFTWAWHGEITSPHPDSENQAKYYLVQKNNQYFVTRFHVLGSKEEFEIH